MTRPVASDGGARATSRASTLAWAACLALGCADGGAPVAPAETPPAEELAPPANPVAVLRRASVQLRGRLPTPDEAQRAAAGDLDATLDEVVASDALGARVADLLAATWRTRVDRIDPLAPADLAARSLADEPLRMVQRVVDDDLPWRDLVTGAWTMADEHVAAAWPVDRPAGEGWLVSRYTDGRPPNGVLATNGLWWRYATTENNANRGRATALSRIFLCTDFASRPVLFSDEAPADTRALFEQTRADLACANCHAPLDPLGSYLFGFGFNTTERKFPRYDPAAEHLWQRATGLPPTFFGRPAATVADLGPQVADDPRFLTCAARSLREAMLQRPAEAAEEPAVWAHAAPLRAGGPMREVARSILDDPAYRAAGDPTQPDGLMLMPVHTWASVVEALTGWRWTVDGLPMLDHDVQGVRVLAGGVDGRTVTQHAAFASPSAVLTLARAAELAATWAVAHDAERPAADRLFTDRALQGDDVDAALAGLLDRVLGPDANADADARALWGEVFALRADPAEAWAAVLAWSLRDPAFVLY